MLEKGKAPGSHLLSGAVINPRGLQRLFKGRKRIDELPFYGEVHGESVLFLTKKQCAADSDAADDGQSPQLRRVAVAARPLARRRGRGARRDDPAGDVGRPAARRRRARRGRAHGRPRPWAWRRGARELRARLGHRRPRDDPRRGHAGAPDRRGARSLRAAQRQPAGVGARGQGGLEGREAAARGGAHDGLAAARRAQVPRVRRLVHLSDGRRHGHDRHGRRPRLSRRRAVGARPVAGAEDASARAEDPRRRRARAVGREDDSGGRVRRAAEEAARAGAADVRRRCRARERAGAEGDPLRDRVGPSRSGGGVADAGARCVARGRAGVVRRVRPRVVHLERSQRGAEHAAGVRPWVLRRRCARGRDDGDEGEASRRATSRPSGTPSSR